MAIVKYHLPRHPHRHFHAMQRRLQSEELTQEMKLSQAAQLVLHPPCYLVVIIIIIVVIIIITITIISSSPSPVL